MLRLIAAFGIYTIISHVGITVPNRLLGSSLRWWLGGATALSIRGLGRQCRSRCGSPAGIIGDAQRRCINPGMFDPGMSESGFFMMSYPGRPDPGLSDPGEA